MRSCLADAWIARAQPWLGTLVEVALPRADATEARFAAAFARMAHVHRCMSAQDPGSDLARIARDAHRRTIPVDADTCAVLSQAAQLARATAGLFDVTVGATLAHHGHLPGRGDRGAAPCGAMGALHLVGDHRVRTSAPLVIDLGGIAKGYAVDCAVSALRDAGASAGIVNAGGDLRVFGDHWQPIRVRLPASPGTVLHLFDVRDAAVATSADYFQGTRRALVDPRTGALRNFGESVTVVAQSCMLADALTKIVALDPAGTLTVLTHHGAQAVRIDTDATAPQCMATFSAPIRHVRLPSRRAA